MILFIISFSALLVEVTLTVMIIMVVVVAATAAVEVVEEGVLQ